MSVTIKIRRGTSAQWTNSLDPLSLGELGYDTESKVIKIGDGSTLWNNLDSINKYEISEIAQDSIYDALTNFVSTGENISVSYSDQGNYIVLDTGPNVVLTSDLQTAISALGNNIDESFVPVALVGNPDGVATLDSNGKIPDSEIPDTIARDSELFSGSYNDLSNKPNIALGAVQWTPNHYLLPGGENTRYLAGDIVYDGGNIYVANFDNESLPTSNTQYWSLVGSGKRLNIDGRDVPNITYDQLNGKPSYVTIGNTLLDGISGQSYGLIGTSEYLDVKNTNGYNKEIELDIAALETKLDTDGYVKQASLDLKLNLSEPSVDYYVSNSGTGGYLVNGVLNGVINFVKGKKYRIVVDAVGHPFWVQTVSGGYSAANVYSTGVTNAGTDNGSILIELPQNAPDNLYYACEFHSTMQGSINSYSIDVMEYAASSNATSYTISSANSSKMTEFTASTDITITIPSDPLNTTWPIGSGLELRQMGTGRLIFSVTSPATIVSTDGYLKTRTQYSSVFLEKRGSNSWILTGDIDA